MVVISSRPSKRHPVPFCDGAQQTEILAQTYADLLSDRLATKDDLKNLATKEDLAVLRGELKDLWIKMLASQIAIFVAIVVFLRYF